MKKTTIRVLIAILILLLALTAVGGYFLLEHMFPVAPPLNCPNEEDITSISLMQNSNPSTAIELSNYGDIVKAMRNTEPTRNWTIQDYPVAENYYTIEIETSARHYRFFVYAENSHVYLERPYEGIYKTDQQFLDFVAAQFED